MAVRREFLGWSRPALHAAAEWLIERYRRGPLVDLSRVTAIVPGAVAPLALGVYDVIVVNPSGTIGLLDKGFTIVGDPTPVILRASPGSLPTNCTTCTVGLTGLNFSTSPAPTVTATCTRPDSMT